MDALLFLVSLLWIAHFIWERNKYMKSFIKMVVVCAAISILAVAVNAEERAMNNDQPRDCSKLTDAKKKTRCEAFNKALAECKAEGKKVGKELDACLMEKGKKK